MKTKVLAVSLILASLAMVTSCQSKKSEDKKTGAAKVEAPANTDVTKEEIRTIIKSLPTGTETMKLINNAGASYLAGFTNENLNTENLLTRSDKAKALGTVLCDLAYTHLYKQVESSNKLLKISETLTKDLGFEELVQYLGTLRAEYEKNKGDKDALDKTYENGMTQVKKLIYTSSSVKDLSLVYCTGIIKSLNIISYLTLFAPQKDQLLVVLKNQKNAVNAVCQILAKSPADPDLSKYLQALQPINNIFQSTEPFTTKSIEEINKLTEALTK